MEIDPPLKQRIVGAIVLTALAAIFIPMLFDDPVEINAQAISKLDIPPAPEPNESAVKSIPKSFDKVLALPAPEPSVQAEPVPKNVAQQSSNISIPNASEKVNTVPATSLSRWFIQVGSFSQQKNALNLRDKLRKQGFAAYSENYKTKQRQLMYRVRVGPELDKTRAEKMQKEILQKNQMKTILLKE